MDTIRINPYHISEFPNGITINSSEIAVSDIKTKYVQTMLYDPNTDLEVIDGRVFINIPFSGTLTDVYAAINTVSSGGLVTVDINKNGSTILSTKLTIDEGETGSDTATDPVVISDDVVVAHDNYTMDIDAIGTGTKGLTVTCTFTV